MKNLILPFAALVLGIFSCKPTQSETGIAEEVVNAIPTLTEAWTTDTLSLRTPESVIYDADNNIYYVSCIGGVPPEAKDGDGYIAVLGADGQIIDTAFVKGLNGPKGLGLFNGKLYVSDIDEVVIIDIASKAIDKRMKIEGAAFLNDIDVSSSGVVYISDSGTNKVHQLVDGVISLLYAGEDLGGPNGIYVQDSSLMMASFGSGKAYTLSLTNPNVTILNDSIPGSDGVEKYQDGFLISNWNGEVFYLGADNSKHLLLDTKPARNAADIEYNASAKLLLVPEFFANSVTAYNVK